MSDSNPGDVLRDRLAHGGQVLMPGVWDPLSAILAARAGFTTMFLSGFCVSGTLLGRADRGYLTGSEMADVARRVVAVVPESSVVVDADTGYGNALNVVRTVALWEQAGAAGMFLEDQEWPKRCGHMDAKQVIDAADWVAKLQAAVHYRSHLHVTARTDARAVHGLDQAIERAKMARDVGVDAVFVEAPQSVGDLEAIAVALPDVVLVANMVEAGRTPLLAPADLAELGFRLVVSPVSGLFAATRAMQHAFEVLHDEGTLREHLDLLVPFDEFAGIVGVAEDDEIEARYGR